MYAAWQPSVLGSAAPSAVSPPSSRNRPGTQTPMFRLLGALFAVIGLFFLSSGVREWRDARAYLSRVERLEGVVVRLDEHPSPRLHTYYTVAEIRTPAGGRHEVSARRGSNPPAYAPGQRIAVLYDPTSPERSRLEAERGIVWQPVQAGLGLGTAFLLLGTIALMVPGSGRGDRPGRWRGGRGTTVGTFRHTH